MNPYGMSKFVDTTCTLDWISPVMSVQQNNTFRPVLSIIITDILATPSANVCEDNEWTSWKHMLS